MHVLDRIQKAVTELKNGRMVILCDNPSRENEADLVMPAETIDQNSMNFMIRNGTGIVCLSLTSDFTKKLNLPLMVDKQDVTGIQAPFTVTIDAKHNISTGVSAEDRVTTVKTVIAHGTSRDDFVVPGHLFPLLANKHGVLGRTGHTEGSVDIVKIAGFQTAAVICELMNPDGTMMQGTQIDQFANKHNLFTLTIDDIIQYRRLTENLVEVSDSTVLPLEKYGDFAAQSIKEKIGGTEHLVLSKTVPTSKNPTLVRLHSMCTTGDLFASKRCDCHRELHYSLERISTEGGVLIYLNQEGRGIGLFNKMKTYALQDHGLDTVEANVHLGLPIDSRDYSIAANVLRLHDMKQIRLLTNNPSKAEGLVKYGIQVEVEPMPVFFNDCNQQYLLTKKNKLNHTINWS